MLLQPQKSKIASMIVSKAKPDFVQKLGEESSSPGSMETDPTPTDSSAALDSAAQKLISALDSKDTKSVVSVLKNIFEILDADEMDESSEGQP